MKQKQITIDLPRLIWFLVKRCWLIILMAVIGAGGMFWNYNRNWVPTYTASATIYVVNSNPNLVNYEYTSINDLSTAVQLIDTYMVVIRSNTVMDRVLEKLASNEKLQGWPLSNAMVSASLSMASVNQTGVMCVNCTTVDPVLSMEICNTVVDVAPAEIKRVVGAGSVEVVDYATLPMGPNPRGALRQTAIGAAGGMFLACGILFLIFMFDRRVKDERELAERYDVPLLATILRMDDKGTKKKKKHGKQPETVSKFLISDKSGDTITESYKNLRTNLRFALMDSTSKLIVVTSAMPGEGKSTTSANLGLVAAQDNRKVLLIDGDMRRPSQHKVFAIGEHRRGLSMVLLGNMTPEEAIYKDVKPGLDLLPVGLIPPNPSEMINSRAMRELIGKMEKQYDVIIMDVPPVNAVTDALVLSDIMAGLVFVIREKFSDHREITKALTAIEYTHANLLGFVLSGVEMSNRSYYQRRYYHRYYGRYYAGYRHRSVDSAKTIAAWEKAVKESEKKKEDGDGGEEETE